MKLVNLPSSAIECFEFEYREPKKLIELIQNPFKKNPSHIYKLPGRIETVPVEVEFEETDNYEFDKKYNEVICIHPYQFENVFFIKNEGKIMMYYDMYRNISRDYI